MEMNKSIAKMMEEIERRGGIVRINTDMPDEVVESFLEEILDCPDCLAEARELAKSRRDDH